MLTVCFLVFGMMSLLLSLSVCCLCVLGRDCGVWFQMLISHGTAEAWKVSVMLNSGNSAVDFNKAEVILEMFNFLMSHSHSDPTRDID